MPVYTATETIEPAEEDRGDKALEIIGESVKKANKAAIEAFRKYKPKKAKTEDTDDTHKINGLAIALVSILITAILIWVFFKDKIMGMLGWNESYAGFNGTKIIRG